MDTFRVVLEGRCLEGFSAEAVKTGLSRLMRVAEEVVDEILQGRDTTVKTGLNQATGDHYVAALRAVGAACRLEQENLHFDVPSRAGFSKTNPASDTEYPLGNSSAPIAPLAQSSAIPSAAAEYVSAAIEPKHRTLGGGGVSGIPASKQHFLAKPAFRNILWLVTCALVLFAARVCHGSICRSSRAEPQ